MLSSYRWLLVILLLGSTAGNSQTDAKSAALKEFDKQLKSYAELHNKIDQSLSPPIRKQIRRSSGSAKSISRPSSALRVPTRLRVTSLYRVFDRFLWRSLSRKPLEQPAKSRGR